MYYNKWVLKEDENGFELTLDTSDTKDRVSKKEHKPTAYPGGAFIYYPRKNKTTDKKYKQVLLDYILKDIIEIKNRYIKLEKEINKLKEEM